MTRPQTNASDVLWRGISCFEQRWRKSAAALAAIQQDLRRHQPLHGREHEFLDLYARVEVAEPRIFSKVWRDPRAYLWARLAHELLNGSLRGTAMSDLAQRYIAAVGCSDVRAALARHLDQFKMFALAVAVHAKDDLRTGAWQPLLPFAIPATPWSISAPAPVAITGVIDGRLQVATADGTVLVPLDATVPFAASNVMRHRCPILRHAGCEVLVQPHSFRVPALRDVAAVVSAGVDFQWQHYELLNQIMQAMERYDGEIFAQFRDVVSLIALQTRPENGTANTSHSQLPGAFMASVSANALIMAQDFIHEFCHNRLFAIEEQGKFFDERNGSAHTDARYYSPWRFDPRPLHGIFHAVYVFTRLTRFWLNVYRDEEIRGADRDFVPQRLLRITGQLNFGVEVLQRHASFTDLGRTIFDALLGDLAHAREEIAACQLPADAPALTVLTDGSYAPRLSTDGRPLTALETVYEHRRLYDPQYARNAA